MLTRSTYRVRCRAFTWQRPLLATLLGLFSPLLAQCSEALLRPATVRNLAEPAGPPTELWFVELTGSPVAEGGSVAAIRAEQRGLRNRATAAGMRLKERLAFEGVWNGFSIELRPDEVTRVQRLPGVKAVHPVQVIPRPQVEQALSPAMIGAIGMTGADTVHSELGYDGTGIRVAVIDSGIDIDHPDLGGNGVPGTTSFPNAKLVAGWDFVGDAYNADPSAGAGYNPIPAPDDIPDDCNGHGTHVAGIIGADGDFDGVAPNVTLGAYRVFGCSGSTTSDMLLAAMDLAFAHQMQIVNLSVAQHFLWPQSPVAVAADRLVLNGVTVVCAVGNAGASLYSSAAPAVADKAIAVASFDNDMTTVVTTFTVPDGSGGTEVIPYLHVWGSTAVPAVGTLGTLQKASPLTACSTVSSLVGRVALIQYAPQTCSLYSQVKRAQDKGAAAVVVFYHQLGMPQIVYVVGSSPVTIPVVMITQADGQYLSSRLDTGTLLLTWSDEFSALPASGGGLISSFSSYGVSPDLTLKPDIGAPGGRIASTYPLEKGAYAMLSGTSMASPHVAGAVALFLQAYPTTHALYLRHYLLNTATPVVYSRNPSGADLEPVHRQGAGMIDIHGAILATTRIEPGKLTLGEGVQSKTIARELKLVNLATASVLYDVSYVNALSTAGIRTATTNGSDARVTFDQPALTLPARGKKILKLTFTPPSGPDQALYGGYIVFTPRGGGEVHRVPFAGFLGDYQSIQVLTPTSEGYPWLATGTSAGYSMLADGQSFSMQQPDLPSILFHCEHQSRLLRMEALRVSDNKNLGSVVTAEYVPRNSTATDYFELPWDGTLFTNGSASPAPNGDYRLKLSVLKALGDAANPDHWETWTSPWFRIARQ